jgi:4-amino-4-deoxy-L-arabinose transferase-like glycosyltransferase
MPLHAPMIADTLVCLLLVLGVAFGLSRPFIGWFRLRPAETVVAGAALSLIAAWGFAWAVFVSGCPLWMDGALPILACVFLVAGRRGLARLLADPAARDLAVGQLIVTAWCVAWLSFIRNYSGGAWIGDWVEHWERARFFLRELPRDHLFYDIYQLPARPPLANVLAAAFLAITSADFAHFQVVTTILCSLAFLPVGLLAGRLGGRPAARAAAAILMVNPMFLQNATYPWTKLQAVFFILAGLYFFLRLRDGDSGPGRTAVLCAVLLGGAVLTHYSAGPYVAVLAAAWVVMGSRRGWDAGFARASAAAALAGACVLAPWFAWSVAEYGWHGTFLSNSTVAMGRLPGNPLIKMALNLRDTFVPPQIRGFKGTLFVQTSPWGSLRDQLFLVYQLNPLLALGCVGWAAVVRESWRTARAAGRRDRAFWVLALGGIVAVSFAAYGDRDHYGIGHICLQSVVLLGLAFLASRWGGLGRGWKLALLAGWAADLCLGIALQFAVEDFAIDRWRSPGMGLMEVSRTYSVVSQANLSEKIIAHLRYFSDILPVKPAIMLALLAAILGMALLRARRTPASLQPQP